MASEVRRLIKNSAIYSVFTILQRAFNVVLLPLYTTYLTETEYGVLSLMLAFIPLMSLILGLSIRGSASYFYYTYKDREDHLKRLFGTSVIFILIFSTSVVLILISFNSLFFSQVFSEVSFYPYVLLALLSSLFQPLYLFYQSFLRAKQKAKQSSILDMMFFITTILLTVLMIWILDMGVTGALLAITIANLLTFVYSLYGLKKYVIICFDIALLKETLKFSLPILPHNLAGWATNLSDRLILNLFTALSTVAIFDIGSQIGKVISIVSMGINQAYNPWFIQNVKSGKSKVELLARSAEFLTFFYASIAVLTSLVAPELIHLLGNGKYKTAWEVVPFIAMAFAVNGFYFCFTSVFFLNNTKYLPLLTITGALINLLLNFLLIPVYGIIGAAIARLISKLIFVVITYLKSQTLYFIPYNIKRIITAFLIAAILCSSPYIFPEYLANSKIWIKSLLLKTALFSFAFGIIFFIKRKFVFKLIKGFRQSR